MGWIDQVLGLALAFFSSLLLVDYFGALENVCELNLKQKQIKGGKGKEKHRGVHCFGRPSCVPSNSI